MTTDQLIQLLREHLLIERRRAESDIGWQCAADWRNQGLKVNASLPLDERLRSVFQVYNAADDARHKFQEVACSPS